MQQIVKRRLTKVALALVVAGYCSVPAMAANGNLKSGQWQIVSDSTGTIQGTVPWITRAADKTTDTDKDHVTVTVERASRTVISEGDKQFHVGDKVTLNWAIGDTEGDLDANNTATKATMVWCVLRTVMVRMRQRLAEQPGRIATQFRPMMPTIISVSK